MYIPKYVRANRKHYLWSEELEKKQDSMLIDIIDSKMTLSQVQAKYEVSSNTVVHLVRHQRRKGVTIDLCENITKFYGVKHALVQGDGTGPCYPQHVIDSILAMRQHGIGYKSIAKSLSVSSTIVRYHARKHGL